jgi:hypothetical protein
VPFGAAAGGAMCSAVVQVAVSWVIREGCCGLRSSTLICSDSCMKGRQHMEKASMNHRKICLASCHIINFTREAGKTRGKRIWRSGSMEEEKSAC